MSELTATDHRKSFFQVAVPAVVACFYLVIVNTALFRGVLIDEYDISVYYKTSDWVVGGGTLYKNIFSEYPLLANLVFAFVRLISIQFGDSLKNFYLAWVTFSSILFVTTASICLKATNNTRLMNNISTLTWLLPSTVYFALLRYDIYPCFTTLSMMLSVRDKRYYRAAIWMGLTIALKGYAIFLLPAFCIYLYTKTNIFFAAKAAVVSVFPFLSSLAVVIAFAGVNGLLAPFKFWAMRDLHPESSYQILTYLTGKRLHASDLFPFPFAIQSFFSIFPALRKPCSFDGLLSAFGVSLLGWVTFSAFYSPQYILWILPILSFSPCFRTRALLLLFSAVTSGYFLVSANPSAESLAMLVIGLVSTKIALLASCIKDLNASSAAERPG